MTSFSALVMRSGVKAVRGLVSTRRCRFASPQTNHAAAAAAVATSTDDEQNQNQNQDTLRATLRDLPGPIASSLADELLLCGALSASVDEFRPAGAAEQALFGARGRDKANDDDGSSSFLSPDSPSSALFWERSTLTVIFDPAADVSSILNEASGNAGIDPSSLPGPVLSVAKASEWMDALRGAFSPVFIDGGRSSTGGGRSLWILPEGSSLPESDESNEKREEEEEEEEAAAAAVVVRLTPGLAFGSGDHPTTRLCLRWLASSFPSSSSFPPSLLDYGTGSGVLAAAAVALGCRSAVGTDVDALALVAAAENVALNFPTPSDSDDRPTFRTVLVSADPGSPEREEEEVGLVGSPESFDAVVANILRGPLLALGPRLSGLAKPGAPFAVSGILASQAEQVRRAFEEVGVELSEFGRERATGGDDEWWVCLSGRKRL